MSDCLNRQVGVDSRVAKGTNLDDLVTVVILTYNEELHIKRCLMAISRFASRIVVVDSFSTDRTVEFAHQMGAEVLQNKFLNQAVQFQWALDNADIKTNWVMRLDADEVIEPALAAEIERRLPSLDRDVVGVNLKRKHIFLGRWIRHGGRFPLVLMRIWRVGFGRVENRWMDEHILVSGGKTVLFDNTFSDHNLNDLTYFTDKHNKYATREAIEVLNQKYELFPRDDTMSSDTASTGVLIKRILKEKIYNHLPFWVGPLVYFLYRMTLQLGFLDGKEGLIYHFLQGLWYRFLVGSKIVEFDRELSQLPDRHSRLVKLERMTGFDLTTSS